jgi:fructose-bisphosphate aldolase class I
MTKNAEIETTAHAMVTKGKGLLAADESFPTIQKRFAAQNLESTAETRRMYREMLFSTSGIESYISGIIMFDETIRQNASNGQSFVELLKRRGIIPGIKVDKGTFDMPGFPGEKLTAGLDGLRDRLKEYRDLGARFTKWRAVITIGSRTPTPVNIEANARFLALFAALSQEAGVLMDGDHDIDRCEEASFAVLETVFAGLRDCRVHLEGMLLKASMVLPGKRSPNQVPVSQVAETTIRTLRRVVPAAVPGIVFLSGGQSPEEATRHLNAMNALGSHPWEISFSFARALQEPALKTWKGAASNVAAAQRIFFHRAKCNSEARYGKYSEETEKAA